MLNVSAECTATVPGSCAVGWRHVWGARSAGGVAPPGASCLRAWGKGGSRPAGQSLSRATSDCLPPVPWQAAEMAVEFYSQHPGAGRHLQEAAKAPQISPENSPAVLKGTSLWVSCNVGELQRDQNSKWLKSAMPVWRAAGCGAELQQGEAARSGEVGRSRTSDSCAGQRGGAESCSRPAPHPITFVYRPHASPADSSAAGSTGHTLQSHTPHRGLRLKDVAVLRRQPISTARGNPVSAASAPSPHHHHVHTL